MPGEGERGGRKERRRRKEEDKEGGIGRDRCVMTTAHGHHTTIIK